jgi:hypothetical protein
MADNFVPPPNPFFCPPVSTKTIFDCMSGPGYLRIRWVGPQGTTGFKDVYTGSQANCAAQKAKLMELRPTITQPVLIAACTIYKYQTRFQIDQFGNLTNLPSRYYDTYDECVQDAAAIMKN